MILLLMGVRFAQFQGSKRSSGLFEDFMEGYIKYYDFSQQQLSVVVVIIGNQSGGPQFNPGGWPILNSCFIIFMFSSNGGHEISNPI